MRKLTFLKPDIRKGVMKNAQAERFTYLAVPEHAGINDLKRDIKLGAAQYKDLVRIAEKENNSKYVVVTAQNMEMGYMAISYLAACYNERVGNRIDNEMLNDEADGVEKWSENNFQIPIINSNEINTFSNPTNNPFAFGDVFTQGNCFVNPNRPYWTDCTALQVCVVVRNNGMLFVGGNSVLDNSLDIFKNNSRVYVLMAQNEFYGGSLWDDEIDDDDFKGGSEEEWFDDGSMDQTKYIILNYAADEVVIKLEKEYRSEYYRQVLKGFFEEYDIVVNRSFAYRKIVDIILAMNDKNKCELIEKIIKYAIKDMNPDKKKELTIENFKFIDRFVKSRIKNGNENKTSASRMSNELIGMDAVKEQVYDIVNMMKYNRIRAGMNLSGSVYHNVHAMLGAPGTAKTTVAKLMGQMMVEQGLLRDNRFICVNGAELKGKYVGHSAPKTKSLFENYDIIVIDEAYSLVDGRGETDSFSNEAIAQLIIELEEHSTDKLVIFAGYGGKNVSEKNNKMRNFFDANPGIKSRITSTIYFDSYSPEEMVRIFYKMAEVQNFIVDKNAGKAIYAHFCKRVSDENFGNGREARSLLETSILFAAKRLFVDDRGKYTKSQMQTLEYEDITQAIERIERSQVNASITAEKTLGFV